MNADKAVARLLRDVDGLLLDFDGPICAIFSSTSAATVAEELSALLRGVTGDPNAAPNHEPDPMGVLRAAAHYGPEVAKEVAEKLTLAEVRAITGAAPTRDADTVLRACHLVRVPVAIVSNNSTAAVSAYLTAHELDPYVTAVAGRTSPDPAWMKPNPHLVLLALAQLGIPPQRAVFVGDSITDIEGGRAAGVLTLGYANKPGKHELLKDAGAAAVIDELRELADNLISGRRPSDRHISEHHIKQ